MDLLNLAEASRSTFLAEKSTVAVFGSDEVAF